MSHSETTSGGRQPSATRCTALMLLNTITNDFNELPSLKSHQGPWTVKDGRDPETFVTASDCPLQFKARDYFPRMPVATEKWDFVVDAHAVALRQAGGA